MSSRITTLTPFIDKEVLCRALTAVGCGYTVEGNTIITDRKDYYFYQKFELINGRFSFIHEDNAGTTYRWNRVDMPVLEFLRRVEAQYNAIYPQYLEELRQKREEQLLKGYESERLRVEAEKRHAEAEKRRLDAERRRAEAERRQAEAERRHADAERRQAEAERYKADADKRHAEAEKTRLAEERLWAEEEQRRLKEYTRQAEEERQRLEEERLWTEEEMRRMEEERHAYVELQRQSVITKAKSLGYDIHEERIENKVKLVLVRNTY